ncbi:exodeoxyribonuclease V subunit gamma, partial [bacterium]|nr:exodeoxyribonuclease V subunit gamma [bacterium]
ARDKNLTPMDVLVMAPNITEYTPFIEAVFSNQSPQSPDYIPYSISDRQQGLESQIVNAFLTLLRLPNSRLKAPEVMDLLAVPAVHEKFGLTEPDLLIIRQWLANTGVRWGWNAAHRVALGLPAYAEASWEFGLNRLLAGYAIGEIDIDTEDWLFGDIAPYSDVEGDTAEILGRFLEFVTSLRPLARLLNEDRPPADWCSFLSEQILDRYFVSDDANYRDLLLLRMTLEDFSKYAAEGKYTKPVSASLVEDYLSTNFQETNDRDGFFRGKVTFCSLLPMRSVPVKIICLLGMNDGAFPRQDHPLGFDQIAETWQRCDRSQRYDDRYMFLESIISARQKFYISYIGRGNRENNKIPPSVLVAELKDYLQERFILPPSIKSGFDKEELFFCEIEHRLQPFNRQYFDDTIPGLFSYSAANFAGARHLLNTPEEKIFFPKDFLLAAPGTDENELLIVTPERLAQFFASPCEFLLRQRLRINLRLSDTTLESEENFEPNHLEIYFLKQEITRAILSDIPAAECRNRLQALGMLPPGADGSRQFSSIWQKMWTFFTMTPIPGASQLTLLEFLHTPKPEPKVQEIFKINGMPIQYTAVLDQWLDGRQVYFRYAKNRPRDLLHGFIWHLTATLHHPSDSYMRGYENKRIKAMLHFPRMDKKQALEILEKLVRLYLTGIRQPLPFSANASFEHFHEQQKSDIPVPVKWDLSAYEALCFQHNEKISAKFSELAISIFRDIVPEEVKL